MGTGPEHLGGDFFEITGQFPFYDHEGVNIPPHLRPALAVLRTGIPFFNQSIRVPTGGREARMVDVQLPTAQPR